MAGVEDTCASLRAQISATEAHLAGLKRDLADAEKVAQSTRPTNDEQDERRKGTEYRWPLLQEEYRRYGRQMIVSQIGLEGKRDYKLSNRQRGTKKKKKRTDMNILAK